MSALALSKPLGMGGNCGSFWDWASAHVTAERSNSALRANSPPNQRFSMAASGKGDFVERAYYMTVAEPVQRTQWTGRLCVCRLWAGGLRGHWQQFDNMLQRDGFN